MGLKEDDVGKLEENAAKRKMKIEAMKNRKLRQNKEKDNDNSEELPESKILFK